MPAADCRRAADIGRRARLELTFSARAGRTELQHGYAEPPLRVGRAYGDADGSARMILATSAPGIFGGDRFEQLIRVEAGAHAQLRSQAALQVHPTLSGAAAMIRSRVVVESGAVLSCVWDPVVPFHRAALDQRADIDAGEGARLLWSDAMMRGRDAAGERWQFAFLRHELRIRSCGRLVYLERYLVAPEQEETGELCPAEWSCGVRSAWRAADASHFGTIIRLGYGDTADTAERLHATLQTCSDAAASADLLEDDLLLVRLATRGGVAFHGVREAVMGALADSLQNR